MHVAQYALAFVIPGMVALGLFWGGLWNWAAPFFVYGLVPLAEIFLRGTKENVTAEKEATRGERLFANGLLYALLPIQVFLVSTLLLRHETFSTVELTGAILGVGTMIGAIAINGAHEIGHHSNPWAKFQSRIMLTLSLYPHFSLEHNKGHHIRMATPDDPATARSGQWVYTFWFQSIWGGTKSAWNIEKKRLSRTGKRHWSLGNGMIQNCVAVLLLLSFVGFFGGAKTLAVLVITSLVGILLLETVNYLQHYALQRKPTEKRDYEKVGPAHSWTSNHPLSRALLFDLPRHADHHIDDRRHYTSLRHLDGSPELPQGYPAMILMALLPPLFIHVMDRELRAFQEAMGAPATPPLGSEGK